MREAGVTPDTDPEGVRRGQFEVTMGPQRGVTIAGPFADYPRTRRLVARELLMSRPSRRSGDPAGSRQRRACPLEHAGFGQVPRSLPIRTANMSFPKLRENSSPAF
ncbi:hypothetical protein F2981_01670 [Sinorhizobium meliloti]|nr:hypothetical protein [Sinorhizobium meliloti]